MDTNVFPFCMRCFKVGAIVDEQANFCHMCGSEGTCKPMKREDILKIKNTPERT